MFLFGMTKDGLNLTSIFAHSTCLSLTNYKYKTINKMITQKQYDYSF